MRPIRHGSATHNMGPPKDWDSAKHGECSGLFVAIDPKAKTCTSYWMPTREELGALLAGKAVKLIVVGGQPPVTVEVDGT
jgi:hypothetical protein